MSSEMTATTPTEVRIAITPYLCVKDSDEAIDFYKRAFHAVEVMRLPDEDGRISHAEITIGDIPIMISDEYPEINVLSPETIGNSPIMLILEVADADEVFDRAVAEGATVVRPVSERFDGEMRNGKLDDPFGHRWMILSRKR